MCLWLPILGISLLFLIAHTGKMSKPVAQLYIDISWQDTGIPLGGLCHHILSIWTCHCVPLFCQTSSWVVLVGDIPHCPGACDLLAWDFIGALFFLYFPAGNSCVLVSKEVNLCSLQVTCYLFYMACCSLGAL